MILLESLQQHLLRVLIGNVPNHDRGSTIGFDLLDINHVGLGFFVADGPAVANGGALDEVVVSVGHHLDHHGHAGGRVAGIHVALLELGGHLGGKAGSDGVGTMLGLLCNDPHAGVDNRTHHLVLLFALGRFSALGFVGGVHPWLLLVLILQQKNGVVKGLLAVGGNLAPIAARDAQLGEGALLFLLLLGGVLLGELPRGGLGSGGGGLLLLLLGGGGHEAVESGVLEGDHPLLPLTSRPLLRLVAPVRRSASPLHEQIMQYNRPPPPRNNLDSGTTPPPNS